MHPTPCYGWIASEIYNYVKPPEPDADGDGVPDNKDGCDYDPNKIKPGICGCGKSDIKDDDGDGFLDDCQDKCIGQNGPVDGCPPILAPIHKLLLLDEEG